MPREFINGAGKKVTITDKKKTGDLKSTTQAAEKTTAVKETFAERVRETPKALPIEKKFVPSTVLARSTATDTVPNTRTGKVFVPSLSLRGAQSPFESAAAKKKTDKLETDMSSPFRTIAARDTIDEFKENAARNQRELEERQRRQGKPTEQSTLKKIGEGLENVGKYAIKSAQGFADDLKYSEIPVAGKAITMAKGGKRILDQIHNGSGVKNESQDTYNKQLEDYLRNTRADAEKSLQDFKENPSSPKAEKFVQYRTAGAKSRDNIITKQTKYLEHIEQLPDGTIGAYRKGATPDAPLSETEMRVINMTEDEKAQYEYILGAYGKETAKEYYKSITPDIDKRIAAAQGEQIKNIASDHKIMGSAANVAAGMMSGVGLIPEAATAAKDFWTGRHTKENPYQRAFSPVRASVATAEGITEDMGTVGKITTEIILSAANSTANMVLLGGAGLYNMGLSAAAQSTYQKEMQGASRNEALLYGTIAGAVEIATEKIPFEKIGGLFKNTGSRSLTQKYIMDTLIDSLLLEGTQEAISNLADNIADMWIFKDRSEYAEYAKELISQGMSEKDAQKEAFKKFMVSDTVVSALMGAASGGLMGGAGLSVNGISNAYSTYTTGRDIKRIGAENDVVNTGLEQGTGTKAYKNAQKLDAKMSDTQRHFVPNAYAVGRQANKNAAAIADEAELARLMRERTGFNIDYKPDMPDYAAGDTVTGEAQDNDTININANKGQTIDTLYHEGGHAAQALAGQAADSAIDTTIEILTKPEYKEQLTARLDILRKTYAEQGIKITDNELMRDIAVDMRRGGLLYKSAADYDTATREGYTARRFVPNAARRAGANIKSAFGSTVTNENANITVSAKDADIIRRAWEKADNAAAVNYKTEKTSKTDKTRYSIETDKSGNRYVNVDTDQNVFENVHDKDYAKTAARYMMTHFKNTVMPLSDYDLIKVNKTGIRKYAYQGEMGDITDIAYKSKLKASTELSNLLETAEYVGSSNDAKKHPFAKYGFDYYKTRFVVDGHAFEGIIDVGVSPKGAVFYGMSNVKDLTSATAQGSDLFQNYPSALKSDVKSTTDIISNSAENVNRKLSVDTEEKGQTQDTVTEIQSEERIAHGDKLSKMYTNSMQKDAFTEAFKSEAENREDEFMYEGITNRETYATAQADIEARGDSTVLAEISIKDKGFTAEDTAKCLALMTKYQTEGNVEKAVDVASMLQKKMTNAGQAIQALKIINKLTPEGQFLHFVRQTNNMVEEQIEKHPSKDKIREEIEAAKSKDNEIKELQERAKAKAQNEQHTPEQLKIMREYENAVDNNLLSFIQRAKDNPQDNKTIFLLDDVSDKMTEDIKGLTGIDTTDFSNALKSNTITHIENDHGENGATDRSMADDRDIARIQYVLDNYDGIELLDKTSAEYRDRNQKPVPLIKISKRIDGTYYVVEAVPDTNKHQIAVVSAYKTKAAQQTADVQAPAHVVRNASADAASTDRIAQDGGNVKDLVYDKEETNDVRNEKISGQKKTRSLKDKASAPKAKNTSDNALSTKEKPKNINNISEQEEKSYYDQVLDKYNIKHLPEKDVETANEILKTISELNDKDDLIKLIIKQSKERKTASHSLVKKALEGQEIVFLKDTAIMQIFGKISDTIPSTLASKMSTYQAMSHLLNARTMLRNIFSNAIFNTTDRIATDVGSIADCLFGLFSGKRSVGVDRGIFEKGRIKASLDRAKQQYIDIALAVNHDTNGSKYDMNSAKRTFKGKTMGGLERAMSYGLQVTDEWTKGGIEYNIQKSFERLKNCGFTQEEISDIVKYEAKYRTFQDDTKLSQLLRGLKAAGNVIGIGKTTPFGRLKTHEFGVGDLIQKYTQVPGALITRSVEYSPLGYLKFLYHVGNAAYNKAHGAKFSAADQRNIALSLGRAVTGTGLIALFALLSKSGIFTGKRDDEDKEVKAMENAEGIGNIQLNLSALSRLLSLKGKTERQNGDVLVSLGFLEPLNTLMAMGDAVAKEGVKAPVNWATVATAQTFDQIMDMSTMNTVRSISNTLTYGGTGWDVVVGVGVDSATGFIPAPVRQLGSALDTTQRNSYMESDSNKKAVARFKSSIPFIREDVPAKITPFGDKKTISTGNRVMDFINNFFSPGYVNIYQTSDISKEIYKLSEKNTDVLPPVPKIKITMDSVKYDVRGENYEKYSRIVGQKVAEAYNDIINSNEYKTMSDEEKIRELVRAKGDAITEADKQYISEREKSFRSLFTAPTAKPVDKVREEGEEKYKKQGENKKIADIELDNIEKWEYDNNVRFDKNTGRTYIKYDNEVYELSDKQAKAYEETIENRTAERRAQLINWEKNIEDILSNNEFNLYADEMTQEQYDEVVSKADDKISKARKASTRQDYIDKRDKFVSGKTTRKVAVSGRYSDWVESTQKKIMNKVQSDATKEVQSEMMDEIKENGTLYHTYPSHARYKGNSDNATSKSTTGEAAAADETNTQARVSDTPTRENPFKTIAKKRSASRGGGTAQKEGSLFANITRPATTQSRPASTTRSAFANSPYRSTTVAMQSPTFKTVKARSVGSSKGLKKMEGMTPFKRA